MVAVFIQTTRKVAFAAMARIDIGMDSMSATDERRFLRELAFARNTELSILADVFALAAVLYVRAQVRGYCIALGGKVMPIALAIHTGDVVVTFFAALTTVGRVDARVDGDVCTHEDR